MLCQQRGQDDDVARGDVGADRAVATAAVEDALERLVDAGPGRKGFRGCRDGTAVQGEDQLVGVADDAVQERAQRGEAGLVEVLCVLRALKDEVEGARLAKHVEGYPGLLTHGPLQALAMAEAARAAGRAWWSAPSGDETRW
jgi:hypothetical protein